MDRVDLGQPLCDQLRVTARRHDLRLSFPECLAR